MLTQNSDCARAAVLAVLFCFAGISLTANAQSDVSESYRDRIHLRNGDVITGDIKELDTGKLRLKTLTMDTVLINWVDIESIDSDKYLRIELADGDFQYGVIRRSGSGEELVVTDGSGETEIPMLAVASVQPILVSESFWRRLNGEISAGLDYKKANDLLIVNLASSVRYKRESYEVDLVANWNETSRSEEHNTSRSDVTGTYTRFLRNRWFWKASAGREHNEELGLDRRTLIGGAAGRYVIQKPIWRWSVNGGLAQNNEMRADGHFSSTEGLIRMQFDVFDYTVPVTRLAASISVYPGITQSDRLRIDTNITLRNEIVRSVFWDVSFYSTYDNQPAAGASQRDYGIVTSIGATF